jgi:hypothetical protein
MKLGIDKTAMVRVRAGISYALTEAMDEGHCGLPTDDLVPLAEKLLEVPQELIRTALDLELADGTVIADMVGDKRCVFLAGLYYRAERGIAERLMVPSRTLRAANRVVVPLRLYSWVIVHLPPHRNSVSAYTTYMNATDALNQLQTGGKAKGSPDSRLHRSERSC